MTIYFGYKRLTQPEDWKELVGSKNWHEGQSAFELAHAWQTALGLPTGIRTALESAGEASLAGIQLDVALVERPVFLGSLNAPSMTDLMGHARNAADEPVVLAVEGKAQEPFGAPVRAWLRGDVPDPPASAQPHRTRTRRFEFLCARLGLGVDLECQLRYQLFHRTVSAVMEAELYAAAAAVVIVHAFGPQSPSNWKDYELFLQALGAGEPMVGKVSGPILLGTQRAMKTFFLWWQDPVRGQVA